MPWPEWREIERTEDVRDAGIVFLEAMGLAPVTRVVKLDRHTYDAHGPAVLARFVGPSRACTSSDVDTIADARAERMAAVFCSKAFSSAVARAALREVAFFQFGDSTTLPSAETALAEELLGKVYTGIGTSTSVADDAIDDDSIDEDVDQQQVLSNSGDWVGRASWVSSESICERIYGDGVVAQSAAFVRHTHVFSIGSGEELWSAPGVPIGAASGLVLLASGAPDQGDCSVDAYFTASGQRAWTSPTGIAWCLASQIPVVMLKDSAVGSFAEEEGSFFVGSLDYRTGKRRWWNNTDQLGLVLADERWVVLGEVINERIRTRTLDCDDGKELWRWDMPFTPVSADISSEGRRLFVSSDDAPAHDGRVVLSLDIESGEEVGRIESARERFYVAAGALFATTSDGVIRLDPDGSVFEFAPGFRIVAADAELVVACTRQKIGGFDTRSGRARFLISLSDLAQTADPWIPEDEWLHLDRGDVIVAIKNGLLVLSGSGATRQLVELPPDTFTVSIKAVLDSGVARVAALEWFGGAAAVPLVAPELPTDLDVTMRSLDDVTRQLAAGPRFRELGGGLS